MEPGEQVVSAINHRDHILVFGSYGSVIKVTTDVLTGEPTFRAGWKLPMQR